MLMRTMPSEKSVSVLQIKISGNQVLFVLGFLLKWAKTLPTSTDLQKLHSINHTAQKPDNAVIILYWVVQQERIFLYIKNTNLCFSEDKKTDQQWTEIIIIYTLKLMEPEGTLGFRHIEYVSRMEKGDFYICTFLTTVFVYLAVWINTCLLCIWEVFRADMCSFLCCCCLFLFVKTVFFKHLTCVDTLLIDSTMHVIAVITKSCISEMVT